MRVALVTPGFSASDTDWCIPALQDFARTLGERDDVHVYTTCYPHRSGDYSVKGIAVSACGDGKDGRVARYLRQRRAAQRLAADHARIPYDVVHAFWADGGGLVALRHRARLGTPIVVTSMAGELVHEPLRGYGKRRRLIDGPTARRVAASADALIALSRYQANEVAAQCGLDASILPLGIEPRRFGRDGPITELAGEVPVLCVASLVPVKCHDVLLDALGAALRDAPSIHLHIVGSGPLEESLRQQAEHENLADKVTFHGDVDHARLPGLYRGAAFCALASSFESESMVALEAAACGRATVGSAVGLLPELAGTDALVAPGDAAALASVLVRAASDKQWRDTLATRMREVAITRFLLDDCVAGYRELYSRLAAGPRQVRYGATRQRTGSERRPMSRGSDDDIKIRDELQPGDLGRIIALHGICYDALPGYGLAFEAYVARTVAEYVLDAGTRGRIWLAERRGKLVACTAIVLRDKNRGQLRWVLVDPSARGIGLGKELVNRAMQHCRDHGCTEVFLETTDGLPESQSLYESLGFRVESSEPQELWNGVRPMIVMRQEFD